MKFGLIFVIGLWLISTSTFGALDVDDLEKIRAIVKESEDRMRAENAAMEKLLRAEMELLRTEHERLRTEIAASEARSKEHTSQETGKVMLQVDETNKRKDRNFLLLLTFIAVVVGLPQIIATLQRRGERSQNAKIEAQQKQVEAQHREARARDARIAAQQKQIDGLIRELETLKQQKL